MTRQLIVVVHGVGVKQAGISSDLLAAALQDETLVPRASDDFHLIEHERYNQRSRRQLFPCRVRRFEGGGNARVVADFYWGDISNVGSGVLGLLIGIIKTVLGIGHAIRENAIELYGPRSFLATVVDWHVRLIHGPIAALNLVMLVGVAIAWLTGYTAGRNLTGLSAFIGAYAGFATAILVGAVAFWRFRDHQSFLGRHLWGWVLITCLILLASEIVNLRPGWRTSLHELDETVALSLCRDPPQDVAAAVSADRAACDLAAGPCPTPRQVCENHLRSGIFVSGGRLLVLANVFWLLVIGLDIVLVVGTAIAGGAGRLRAVPMLAPVAACGMTFLWLLFFAFVWTAPTAIGWQVLPHPRMLEAGLALATAAAAILAALIVAALVVVARKHVRAKAAAALDPAELREWYFGAPGGAGVGIGQAESNRLIVSRWFGWVFVAGIFLLGACVLAIVLDSGRDQTDAAALFKLAAWIVDTLREWSAFVLAAFGVIGVAVFTYFRAELKAGIEILTDVITYLNDYSWRWGDQERAKTLLEHMPGARHPSGGDVTGASGYWPRRRIQDRMQTLMAQLLAQETPDEIWIVAHSQGTVVAHDVIREAGPSWVAKGKRRGKSPTLGLVTMGSPLSHIHGYYFPSSFSLMQKGDGGLSTWINIFRVDDFVGTHVDASGNWPKEIAVPPGGHTYYWVDSHVCPLLREALAIR